METGNTKTGESVPGMVALTVKVKLITRRARARKLAGELALQNNPLRYEY